MTFVKLCGLVAFASLSAGCAMSANNPTTGFIYTGSKGATTATANSVGGKTGRACSSSILGVVSLGDSSVKTAAEEGGISKVATVDSDNFAILGIYAKNCTIVSGE